MCRVVESGDSDVALTPMMQQYLEIKESYPDALLLFRLGDFYELFFEDATLASKVLEITLTGRDAGEQGRVPMCGVPYHAAEQYIGRLLEVGYCVAICEQVEDPKQAKGLVKREVIRVVTPGTWLRDGESARRLMAAFVTSGDSIGAAMVDVSTGEFWYGTTRGPDGLAELLQQWQPIEVLVSEADEMLRATAQHWCEAREARLTLLERWRFAGKQATNLICAQYGVAYIEALGLEDGAVTAEAVSRILSYLQETQKQLLAHLKSPQSMTKETTLRLDMTARRNLELTETQRTRQKRGSLLGLLDRTQTAMGSRLLRRWIEEPLCDVAAIGARQEAVGWLVNQWFVRAELEELLARIYDMERLTGKIGFGSVNARDLLAIARSLETVPQLSQRLTGASATLLVDLFQSLPDLSDLAAQVVDTLVDQPPTSTLEGGMIRSAIDLELDDLRAVHIGGKQWLAEFEQQERERTGIRTLKVGYNKVFGYYLEVSKANVHLVPNDYQRKQTLAAAERYTLDVLQEQAEQILHAQERALAREYQLFQRLRDEVAAAIGDIQRIAESVAVLDTVTALATAAAEHGYVQPAVVAKRGIHICNGRHPMVEAAAPGAFVPNSVRLGAEQSFILLTGPNMAGKSTYMRQTALIVLMAHMGSFVPAEAAEIGLVDRIFTRIGASDDLGAGQSTFMVEMVELAQILRQSSQRSLILLDEIGRGTSTYDGMSIAEAVMEALLRPANNPLTLFATHYHELTVRSADLPGVRNLSVAVQETETGVTFLHAVVERPADRSYGIQVAKLAGVPDTVTRRATEILAEREAGAGASHASVSTSRCVSQTEVAAGQAIALEPPVAAAEAMVPPALCALVDSMSKLAVDEMTPIAAIAVLSELVQRAREVEAWVTSRS